MKLINKSSVIGFILGAIISPLAIVGGFCLYLQSQMSKLDDIGFSPPEIPIERKVTLDWKIQNVDGREFVLSDQCDNELLFLNFWATWCPPCVGEMPSIEKLYHRFKERIVFVCISNEEIKTIKHFGKKKGYTFPMYHIEGKPPEEFETNGIPATFIVSREQKIVLKHVGGADWAHESVINFLEGLLALKAERVAALGRGVQVP